MQSVCISKRHYRQESRVSCVAASARIVLSFFGIEVEEEYLRRILKTKPYGTNVANLLHLNREDLGVRTMLRFFSMSELIGFIGKKRTPCIVVLDTAWLDYWEVGCLHTVVVVGFDEEEVAVLVVVPLLAHICTSIG